jgi:hypothetical protein
MRQSPAHVPHASSSAGLIGRDARVNLSTAPMAAQITKRAPMTVAVVEAQR